MPTSSPKLIDDVVMTVSRVSPKTILDVGCGYGKYGVLLREVLELWCPEPKFPTAGRIKIDAVEINSSYITQLTHEIYDEVYQADIMNVIDNLPKYDLILMVELIEHLSIEDGKELIRKAKEKCGMVVIVTPANPHGRSIELGNPTDEATCFWSEEDFEEFGASVRLINVHFMALIKGELAK